jgi:hypothetical protein
MSEIQRKSTKRVCDRRKSQSRDARIDLSSKCVKRKPHERMLSEKVSLTDKKKSKLCVH